jgi:transketolase
MGDGELGEGQIWEAAMAAGQFQLGSLVGIVDRNHLSIDGNTESIMGVEPLAARFESFGWETHEVDGHDLDALLDVFDRLETADLGRPQMVIADTVKGRGVRRMEGDAQWHVGNLVGADYDDVITEIERGLQPVAAGGPHG